MRGKIGLVIGLGAGYVLGTRAGRERYEQIKTQAVKVWNLDPVQERVDQVKGFATSGVMALPGALVGGVVKVSKAAGRQGTAGQKLDSVIKVGKSTVDEVKRAAEESRDEVAKAADDVAAAAKKTGAAAKDAAADAAEKTTPPRGEG